jgi:hypothetical protein
MRNFTARVAAALNSLPVELRDAIADHEVIVEPKPYPPSPTCMGACDLDERRIYIYPPAAKLGPSSLDALLAHEIGHAILGWCGTEEQSERETNRLAKAWGFRVEHLMAETRHLLQQHLI